jgi:hypothetical protein
VDADFNGKTFSSIINEYDQEKHERGHDFNFCVNKDVGFVVGGGWENNACLARSFSDGDQCLW